MSKRSGQNISKLQFWQRKIVQLLHDPVAKPYASYPQGQGFGGHQKVALRNLEKLTEVSFEWIYNKAPDLTATGADRPMMHLPNEDKKQIKVQWPDEPLVSHPLEPCWLSVKPLGESLGDEAKAEKRDLIAAEENYTAEFEREEEQDTGDEKNTRYPDDPIWQDADGLKNRHLMLWRSTQEALRQRAAGAPVQRRLWQIMPADSRAPDHAIWDHNRLASALAFIPKAPTQKANADHHICAPWLFRFELGPVGRFISESRSSSDLWMSSFLLAEMSWSAMQPIVAHYGPDCIIYPDLRGNPRADVWLAQCQSELDPSKLAKDLRILPEELEHPGTYAAVLPNTFTAILPLGGGDDQAGHLEPLETFAKRAQEAVEQRWQALSAQVESWLLVQRGEGTWQETFKRHAGRSPFACTWVALRWSTPLRISDARALFGPALPASAPPISTKDRAAVETREEKLRAWVSATDWGRYTEARRVFTHTNPGLMKQSSGHDYALLHHQLRIRHQLRKQENSEPALSEESGENCTRCGRRQALYNHEQGHHNDRARTFWHPPPSHKWYDKNRLNPGNEGTERLCGVCAVKRFLVEAGTDDGELTDRELTGINPVWAGYGWRLDQICDADGRARVPFPSTATIAAVKYVRQLCLAAQRDEAKHQRIRTAMNAVVQAYTDTEAGLIRTGFARALGALAEFGGPRANPLAFRLTTLDTQNAVFPHTLEIAIRRAEQADQARVGALKTLHEAVRELRRATDQESIDPPESRIAVIRLDGDHMGRLLLGDAAQIQAQWRHILHPQALQQIRQHPHLIDSGWLDLLHQPRLMGPSLHAVISRMLAQFSHRLVPWVVEREFSGRLFYAGGDDVLALAPASDALGIAARLRQLFSAAWVIDTQPQISAWDYRHGSVAATHDPERARGRFLIPARPAEHGTPVVLPLGADDIEDAVGGEARIDWAGQESGEILPMLGAGVTLSAGIAYGHFKTSLRFLLDQSKHLLETRAKAQAGRNAIALSLSSRNGVKAEALLKDSSNVPGCAADGAPCSAYERMQKVIEGFKSGLLPGRLPYKLQQSAPLLAPLDEKGSQPSPHLEQLLRGVFRTALESNPATAAQKAACSACSLWRDGWQHQPGRAEGALLIARALARQQEEEE
ncbi:MAG: type III-B CRISPR-associated protein Cas10/Cmr2 [Gammaproteobacteria bacterium]|nr:type III-B CRISPR-associated protein Cas10/Cmr2 [Gammaproteobacteria bacterium]